MAAESLFREVLDETLAASTAVTATSTARIVPSTPIATAPFLAASVVPPVLRAEVYSRWAAAEAPPRGSVVAQPGRAPTDSSVFHLPALHLDPAARRALAAVRELGAPELPSRFTRAELRQAFRRLSLRYHPDRSPWCGPAERARLAAAFGQLSNAYRALAASLKT
jgi:hypothetical protein